MVHSSFQDPEMEGERGDSGMLTGEFGAVPATQENQSFFGL